MPNPTPVPQPQPDPDGRPGPHNPPGPKPAPGAPPPEIPDHLKPKKGADLPPNLRWSETLGMFAWFPEESVTRRTAALVGVHGFRRQGGGSLR